VSPPRYPLIRLWDELTAAGLRQTAPESIAGRGPRIRQWANRAPVKMTATVKGSSRRCGSLRQLGGQARHLLSGPREPACFRSTSDSDQNCCGAANCATCHLLPYAPQQTALLFDHLVCAQYEAGRDFMADCLRGLEIDDQLEPRRLLDRQIRRLDAAQ
jgi:hypothetical protein